MSTPLTTFLAVALAVCLLALGGVIGALVTLYVKPRRAAPSPWDHPGAQGQHHMPAYPEITGPLSSLTAAVAALPDRIAAAVASQVIAAESQLLQDKADTINEVAPAIQAAADAINQIGQAPPPAPEPEA